MSELLSHASALEPAGADEPRNITALCQISIPKIEAGPLSYVKVLGFPIKSRRRVELRAWSSRSPWGTLRPRVRRSGRTGWFPWWFPWWCALQFCPVELFLGTILPYSWSSCCRGSDGMDIEALCAASPEALAHSPSLMPLKNLTNCAPISARAAQRRRQCRWWRGEEGARRPAPEGQVLRHVLWHVLLRHVLRPAPRPSGARPSRVTSPKGKRWGLHARVGRGFEGHLCRGPDHLVRGRARVRVFARRSISIFFAS